MNDHDQSSPRKRVKNSTDAGLFTMMAMMMVCCAAILVIVALIPLFGWPVGIVVAVLGGAGIMYSHQRMHRGSSH